MSSSPEYSKLCGAFSITVLEDEEEKGGMSEAEFNEWIKKHEHLFDTSTHHKEITPALSQEKKVNKKK